MQIDQSVISGLEKLARLKLTDAERSKLSGDLQSIVNMIDKLQTLDTEGVEPLIWLNENPNALRDDLVQHQLDQSEALSNAPNHDGIYFRVPKVIEH